MHGLAARDEGHALARDIIKARHDDDRHGQLVLREELRGRTGAREHDDGLGARVDRRLHARGDRRLDDAERLAVAADGGVDSTISLLEVDLGLGLDALENDARSAPRPRIAVPFGPGPLVFCLCGRGVFRLALAVLIFRSSLLIN